MLLYPRIACDPPLGEPTVVASDSAEFIVALAWSHPIHHGTLDARLDVVIWHNGTVHGEWAELPLAKIEPPQRRPSQVSQQYFSGTLKRYQANCQPVRFTLKFRMDGFDWQWINSLDRHRDGEIIFETGSAQSNDLSDLLQHLDPCWIVASLKNTNNDVKLWSLESKVAAAENDTCDDFFNPDKGVILASFLREDGLHLIVLALNGAADVLTTMQGNQDGHIVVSARNDSPEESIAVVLVALSNDFEVAVKALMDHARSTISEQNPNASRASPTPIDASDQALEDWRDGFSYCTWNGIGQSLNEEKILRALDSLAENNIDISNLIIDDNWQSLDYKGDSNFKYRWTAFDANKKNFPNELKHTINRLRKRHPHINHIAVWHGIFGHWNGISPTGTIAKEHATKEVKKQSHEGYIGNGTTVTVTAEDVHRLYDDFYGFLTSAGIDAVKADVQFYPDYLNSAPDRRAMMYTYQDAWTSAVQKHFQGRAISCMSMTPQILFHSLLLEDKPRYMARNSDDFFPSEPNSHTLHIFANAHNAVLTSHLNILSDWDMFQTVHEYAGMHAAARCLSGGPVYITDTPGQHDIKLINQMTAKSVAGRYIILRPEKLGMTMEAYVKPNSSRFLRIGTTNFGDSLLGVFNIGDRTRTELVKVTTFRKIRKNRSYVVRKHSTGHLFGPFDLSREPTAVVPVQLDPKGHEILTAFPTFTSGETTATVLSLLGKMSGAAMKTSCCNTTEENNVMVLNFGCKAVGILGPYLSNGLRHLQEAKIKATLRIIDKTHPIEIKPGSEPNVLELDTEKVWGMMRHDIGVTRKAEVAIRIQL